MASPEPKGGSVALNGKSQLQEDLHLRVLRMIEANPRISQRELAEQLNLSLGKANFCVRALIDKGWIKARNFKNSAHKLSYMYALTPNGIRQRALATVRFLERKRAEYEALREEIRLLEQEVGRRPPSGQRR